MNYCNNLLSKDIQQNCQTQLIPGIEPNGIIINRQHIDLPLVAFDPQRSNVITKLPLLPGHKGYSIYLPTTNPFAGTTTTMETGTHRNTFTNTLSFVVLDHAPDVCREVIDALATGQFVVVYENKYKNIHPSLATSGDATFQVVGYYQGLRAQNIENDKYAEETEGGWSITLTEKKVPKAALFLYDTKESYRALFDSLTATPLP